MMKLSLGGIAVVVSAFAVGACGGDGESGSSVAATDLTAIDGCALLTAAEIETATGIAPGAPQDMSFEGSAPMCNWPTADGSNPAFLTVVVGAGSNADSFESAMVEWEESASRMGMDFEREAYEKVDGVGDFGAWLGEAGMLQAQRGDVMITVSSDTAADRDKREASMQLANNALARID